MVLREKTLVDVDCWSRVLTEPLRPKQVYGAIRQRLVDAAAAEGGAA